MCDGQLRVYQDTRNKGYYHYCSDCKSHGDIIQLLQQHFGVGIKEVFAMLSEANPDQENPLTTVKLAQIHARHRRADGVARAWKAAEDELLSPQSDCLHIANKLKLTVTNNDFERWKQGPGKLIRQIDTRTAAQLLSSNNSHRAKEYRFHGKGWKNVLAIPTYTFPGQVQSLIFIGRQGRLMQDVVVASSVDSNPMTTPYLVESPSRTNH